MSASGFLTLGH